MTRKSDQMPEISEERKMQDLLAKMRKLRPELTNLELAEWARKLADYIAKHSQK